MWVIERRAGRLRGTHERMVGSGSLSQRSASSHCYWLLMAYSLLLRVFRPSSFSILLPCLGTGRRKRKGGETRSMENLILKPIVFHQATPNAEIGFLARAVGCDRVGRYVVAWQEALKAISLRPFHPKAYIQMTSTAVAPGDPEAALPAAQRASDLTPKWPTVHQVVQALERTLNAHRKQRKTANPIARPISKSSPPCSLATILAGISSQPKSDGISVGENQTIR